MEAVPSIMDYAQPTTPGMPTAYYQPASRDESSSDSDTEPHKIVHILVIAIVIVLVIAIAHCMTSTRALARKLAERGWIVYLKKGCPQCLSQMGVLHGNFEKYILCSDGKIIRGYTTGPPIACETIPTQMFPYWYNIFTGKTAVGYQPADALREMAKE